MLMECIAETRGWRAVCALRARREARRGHMGDTYLKQHDAPEDREYLCGPPMMAKTVLLQSLGVDDADIRFDNFGG